MSKGMFGYMGREGSNTVKIGMVTLSTPNIESYAKFARGLWRIYCHKNNIDFVVHRNVIDKARPPSWSKIPAIKKMMDEGYDWVWWVDADSLPVSMEHDIWKILAKVPVDIEVILCTNGRHIECNTIITRNSKWARDFFDKVWNNSKDINHSWWEQKSVIEIVHGMNEKIRNTKFQFHLMDSYHRWDTLNVCHNPACSKDTAHRKLVMSLYRPFGVSMSDAIPRFIGGRSYFGRMFSEMGFKTGVEIGVFDGQFSEIIQKQWNGKMYCVDMWKHIDGYRDITNQSDKSMEAKFVSTKKKLEPLGITVMRMGSLEAATKFPDSGIDWAYIDADHRQKSVEADLNAWWPKIKAGGILAGHDYKDDKSNPNAEFGVKSAVDGFFEKLNLTVWETNEADWRSWYVMKPLDWKKGS